MMNPRNIVLLLFLMILSLLSFAQEKTGVNVEMADTMRSNGRIFVVVAVLLTILFGLVLYIVRLDRKISRLEKDK